MDPSLKNSWPKPTNTSDWHRGQRHEKDSYSLLLTCPHFKDSQACSVNKKRQHLQRKLHPSSRHPVPNEVIDAKDDELVLRHLKASLQEKNPTSTVCPARQTSSMGWETVWSLCKPQGNSSTTYCMQVSISHPSHQTHRIMLPLKHDGSWLSSYTGFLKHPVQQLTSSSTNLPVHPLPFSPHKEWLSPHSIIPLPRSVRWWDETSPLIQTSESPPESLLPHSADLSNPDLTLLQISTAPLQGRLPLSKPGLRPHPLLPSLSQSKKALDPGPFSSLNTLLQRSENI